MINTFLGTEQPSAFYVGDDLVTALYLGEDLIYNVGAEPVIFTTTGATFNPTIYLKEGTSSNIMWFDGDDVVIATGLNPNINFGSVGVRTVKMSAENPENIDFINLGFDNSDDEGTYQIGEAYNKTPELVSGVSGLQNVPNIRYFAAANTGLTGFVDFSGLSDLLHIECFQASITSLNLTGCVNLIRLCVEANDISFIDLNPVAPNLRDLRAAVQTTGNLTFAELTQNMSLLYHYCVRDQTVSNHIPLSRMPVIEQYWDWNSGASGAFVSDSPVLKSILSYGNQWTSLDLSDSMGDLTIATVRLSGSPLASVNVDNCNVIGSLRLEGATALPSNQVDDLLVEVNSWGTINGTLLVGESAPPSSVGLAARDSLVSRGWVVTVAEDVGGGGLLWEDTFDRENEPIQSPWQPSLGGSIVDVFNNSLRISDVSGYQRVWALPPELNGVTDYEVEIEFDGTPSTMSWFGILARMDAAGNGTKALFQSNGLSSPRGGLASSSGSDVMVASGPGVPVSWSQPGIHTMILRLQGTLTSLICDGQESWSLVSNNNAGNGNGVGFCGQGQNRMWNRISVTAL